MADFARYIAIDWTGARTNYKGLAVAEAQPGEAPPRLVAPPQARTWRRAALASWLAGIEGPALVGIDAAFGLPWAVAASFFADAGAARSSDLWALVEAGCAGLDDLYGRPFAEAHPRAFWVRGRRPADWREAHRATETACVAACLGRPESPFKLVGARNVGTGSLACFRLLHRLHDQDDVAIWPFDRAPGRRLTLVEIYPRLFIRLAGFGSAKLGPATLDAALPVLASAPLGAPPDLDDHATDALIAAAGLRHLAGSQHLWDASHSDPLAGRAEGWIFGVPAGTSVEGRP